MFLIFQINNEVPLKHLSITTYSSLLYKIALVYIPMLAICSGKGMPRYNNPLSA